MNANNLFKAIMELDLEPIKAKLMHLESGEGWNQEKVEAVEKEYRRFLCLMKLYPEEDTAPMVDVDTFWHYHILDTMKYAADCEQVFGYFLHHYPYVGLRGGNDAQFRIDSGARMAALYEATFREAYPGALPQRDQDLVTYCASATPASRASAARTGAAYCASASPAARLSAYCASASPMARMTAYCASASPAAHATAYCASASPAAQATAYCASASPASRASAAGIGAAYCASPATRMTAYCASASPAGKAVATLTA